MAADRARITRGIERRLDGLAQEFGAAFDQFQSGVRHRSPYKTTFGDVTVKQAGHADADLDRSCAAVVNASRYQAFARCL